MRILCRRSNLQDYRLNATDCSLQAAPLLLGLRLRVTSQAAEGLSQLGRLRPGNVHM